MAAQRIGVGIIAYYGLADVQSAVGSILDRGKGDYDVRIFDNSENDEVGEWIRHHAGSVQYVRSPYNVGCSIARNRLSQWFMSDGCRHFVIQDQDVTWAGDAGAAMLDVFERYPGTGIASWHLATRQMSGAESRYKPDATGAVFEVPGMCCMYSAACVKAVIKQATADGCAHCRAWNTRMLMYRFDTLFCLLANKAGYKTRVVWPDANLVRHVNPHKGVQRNLRIRVEQAHSRRVFAEELKLHGLKWRGKP